VLVKCLVVVAPLLTLRPSALQQAPMLDCSVAWTTGPALWERRTARKVNKQKLFASPTSFAATTCSLHQFPFLLTSSISFCSNNLLASNLNSSSLHHHFKQPARFKPHFIITSSSLQTTCSLHHFKQPARFKPHFTITSSSLHTTFIITLSSSSSSPQTNCSLHQFPFIAAH